MKYLSDLNWWKQLALNVGGVLTAVISFLSVLNIHYKFLTVGSVNSFVDIIIAVGTLVVGSLASLFNTYLTKSSKDQAIQIANETQAQAIAEEAAKQAQAQAELDELKKKIELIEAQKQAEAQAQEQSATVQTSEQVAAATQGISVASPNQL